MAQKQKTSPQKVANRGKLSKKKIALILLLALILAGGLWYAWRIYQSHKRFSYAEQKKNEIVLELTNSLGDNVVSTRVQNECFEAEQGPYLGGTLWCQTATVVLLRKDINFNEIGVKFTDAARKANLEASSSTYITPRYWAKTPAKATCSIAYKGLDDKERLGSVAHLPFSENEHPALTVACYDRAAAKHYPYHD